jgi:hypothetical protein
MTRRNNDRRFWPLAGLLLFALGCSASPESGHEGPPDTGAAADVPRATDVATGPGVSDAATAGPDAATAGPDAATAGPDAATAGPDAATASPDAERATPDAAPGPDASDARPAVDASTTPGCTDEDADGFPVGDGCIPLDCDDDRADVHPGQVETCNGRDDDCDGEIDEALEDVGQPCDTGRPGRCAPGFRVCVLGEAVCEPQPDALPEDEVCNAVDDDCDGIIDDGVVEACGLDVGECRPGVRRCVAGAFGACEGEVGPAEEACNGLDDDCDGLPDDVAPLGGAALSDPAWRANDAPLAVAETADGRRQAVVFHALGVNGEMSLTASTFDLERRTVIATWSFFPTRDRHWSKAWFVDETLFIAFIDDPGSNAAQLQVLRHDLEGRALAAPIVVGGDVDSFSYAVGRTAVGVARSQARGEAWVSIIDRTDGHLVDRHVGAELSLAIDPAVTIIPHGDGFLVGSERPSGVDGPDRAFAHWSVAADGTVGPRIDTGLINGRRPMAVETPDGPRLVYMYRYYGASPHLAIESRAIAADGMLLEPVPLVAFPGDRDAAAPELLFASAHGAAGIVVGEWIPDAARVFGLYLSRADTGGRPWTLRFPARDGEAPLSAHLATGGAGPAIVHAWVRPATSELFVARGALGGCPPSP